MTGFLHEMQNCNPTEAFWWQYMEMVGILLMYTRAQRDGLWYLHLYAFRKMLPITIATITHSMQGGVQYTWLRCTNFLRK